jgi:hypothetical protein
LVINNDSEDPSIYIKDTEGNIVKISGNGSMTVNNAEEAINEASTNNIGQLIYIQNNSSYGGKDYSIGPYIVTGDKRILKLSTSTPSGDVIGDFVQDVKINNKSILDENGIANITLPDFTTFEALEEANKVRERMNTAEEAIKGKVNKEDGKSLISDVEIDKLAGVAEGAQVNIIEKISVNGEELQVADDKSVNITFTQGLIGAGDVLVDSIKIANQGYGKMDVVNTTAENKPSVEKSIEILQNNIAALTMAMSASLNEVNTLIQEMREDIEKLKGTE